VSSEQRLHVSESGAQLDKLVSQLAKAKGKLQGKRPGNGLAKRIDEMWLKLAEVQNMAMVYT
jgi:hypothetical protein